MCVRTSAAPRFALDDIFLGSATLIAIAVSSIIFYAASLGLGRSIELLNPDDLVKVQKLFYASTVLFVFALGLSKSSIVALLLRMTPKEKHLVVFKGTLISFITWTIASSLAIALQCNLAHPWILVGERCPGSFVRWQVFAGLDVVTELVMIILAIYLVWDAKLSRKNKAVVIIAFGLRAPILVGIAFRLQNFDYAGLTVNPTLLEAEFIVWSQAELHFSIVAATVPTLRRFVSGLATNYGALDVEKDPNESSYQLRSYGHSPSSGSTLKSANQQGHLPIQWDEAQLTRTSPCATTEQIRITNEIDLPAVSAWNRSTGNDGISASRVETRDSNSVASNDSLRMIIKKHVAWTVEHAPSTCH
ncbi:hypothetical protein GJ744_005547 [Endocarpon pusillum]|uniref:Rhodopsin domain-containing protein n=1 Tax=Endocarpon pusillum TaxID=364733 RepID=A0A8H7E8R8_9EURO|nr:hypothetical protein GJ744_005547 [Endocarpon pusillum]